jgi:hypothetical protein
VLHFPGVGTSHETLRWSGRLLGQRGSRGTGFICLQPTGSLSAGIDVTDAILQQVGSDRKYRYRFVEPMMQPFILMQGVRNSLITRQQVSDLAAPRYEPRFSGEF